MMPLRHLCGPLPALRLRALKLLCPAWPGPPCAAAGQPPPTHLRSACGEHQLHVRPGVCTYDALPRQLPGGEGQMAVMVCWKGSEADGCDGGLVGRGGRREGWQ